jgi:nitrite reductase/ring-hydroxylating ferredoxin subunit
LPPPSTNSTHNPAALPRRHFLALASGGLACCALPSRSGAATDRPVDVGRLEDYPRDGISEKFSQYDFFVIRHQGRLFAATALCPHKGNLLLADPRRSDHIICSGHNATFGADGVPQGGIVRRALDRFAISVNAAGRVVVDPSRTFRQPQWTDPASFIVVG